MQHVSCRALGILLKAAKRRKVAEAVLTAGVPYDLAYLRDTKHRIEWDAWCRILRNARAVWSLEELSDLNEAFMRSPFFSYVGVIARLLFTSRDLFDWICKKQVGGGAQLFSDCVRPSYEHVGDDVTIIRLEIGASYEPSPEFFWMTRGSFIAMPGMVGAGDAEVDMTIDSRLGTYHVRYQNKRGLSKAMRWLSLPLTARTAALELKRTNEELQSRFLELEASKVRVEEQATQLRTANKVNDLVHGDLDLERTLDSMVHALVDEAGFLRAELHVRASDAGEARTAALGPATTEEPLVRTLATRGDQIIGDLIVVPYAGADRRERDALLTFIVPTLAMALEHAISFQALQNYKANLENIVEQRTTELAGTVVQLEEAHGARQRFFANVSHEIRTPLSIILLAVADVEQRAGATMDPRAKAGLSSVTDSARKLLRLVDELLLLAAGQEDRLAISPEPTNLGTLMTSLVAAWTPAAEAAGLELTGTLPLPIVANVDPVAIERVATNLLSNAVKYTPRGGQVVIELAREDAGLRLSVLDNGPGISDDLMGRLFGRFERADGEHRKITGTGIGLSLVKQLVEAHGGSVAAHRRPTGGTEMRVMLPAARLLARTTTKQPTLRLVDYAAVAPVADVARAVAAPAGVSKGTILIAEDDVRLAEMIAGLLSDEYTVRVAHDGVAALALAKQHHPELLITDVDMPEMDGIELSRRFREASNDKLAPIIILSAMHDLGTRVEGLEAGAVDYVTKPFDPKELVARVAAQFRMRELAVRLHRAEHLATLGILTSGLAHELRNPANGIVNAVRPLRRLMPPELQGEHAVAELLEVIQECATQLGVLSNQLLGFRRDDQKPEMRLTQTRELVERTLKLCCASLEYVDVRIDVPADSALMCAPPMLLQALTNLVENAAYAAGRGGWMAISASVSGDRLSIAVTDSGPGVPREQRNVIFEPFFTTKPQGIGTGLGLSLAREIVVRHGGTLELLDHAGRHAFVLQLPHHAAPAVASGRA